jgi:hypothetical protein
MTRAELIEKCYMVIGELEKLDRIYATAFPDQNTADC